MERLRSENTPAKPQQQRDGVEAITLRSPAMAMFKAECGSVLEFLKVAHHRQAENARRLGVSPDDLHAYATSRSSSERDGVLDTIRHTLRSVNEGHTGSFHDFLGDAARLKAFYKEASRGESPPDPSHSRSPASFARFEADVLFATLMTSQHQAQRGEALMLLNTLANRTAETLTAISREIRAQINAELEGGTRRPASERYSRD